MVWVSHFWPSLLAFLTLLIFASYYFKILWVFTMTVFCFNSIMADYSIILLPILPKKKGDFGLNLSHTYGSETCLYLLKKPIHLKLGLDKKHHFHKFYLLVHSQSLYFVLIRKLCAYLTTIKC